MLKEQNQICTPSQYNPVSTDDAKNKAINEGGKAEGGREWWREEWPTCAASSIKMWVKCPLGKPMRARALAVLSVATTIWYCRSSCIEGTPNWSPSILEQRTNTYTMQYREYHRGSLPCWSMEHQF